MKLIIKDECTLQSLQEVFSEAFPNLKIEFFSKLHEPGAGSGLKFKLYSTKTIGECREIHEEGELEVTPEMTVVDFEQTLGEEYGLGVQVFRKTEAGNWIQTINTDGWTLRDHNEALSS